MKFTTLPNLVVMILVSAIGIVGQPKDKLRSEVGEMLSRMKQMPAGWTWKDSTGKTRTRLELDSILEEHFRWWVANKNHGEPNTRARPANLKGANLSGVNLEGAHLAYADLSDTKLYGANLSRAYLYNSKLINAVLREANLRQAQMSNAFAANADFSGANLSEALLIGTDLKDTRFSWSITENLTESRATETDLTDANLDNADLTGASLSGAILIHTNLIGTVLTNAKLDGANLLRARFEPRAVPQPAQIASAINLELIEYSYNPAPLAQLRKGFQDSGFREQERKIIYAINRLENERLLIQGGASEFQYYFNKILFDWTCRWGLSYGRPLKILVCIWLVCSFAYYVLLHFRGRSGLYVIPLTKRPSNARPRQLQRIRLRRIESSRRLTRVYLRVMQEVRLFRSAMFFSLTSVFNMGYRELSLGGWFRAVTKREYEIKASGWARTVSAFQSLFSVYMIALAVLTYFGRPFS